jgi:predicted transcriptional regulator
VVKLKKGEREMFRTTIELPQELYKQLAHMSIDENRTLKEIMTEALKQYVDRKGKKGGKS